MTFLTADNGIDFGDRRKIVDDALGTRRAARKQVALAG
jgi:hypothetical protein